MNYDFGGTIREEAGLPAVSSTVALAKGEGLAKVGARGTIG